MEQNQKNNPKNFFDDILLEQINNNISLIEDKKPNENKTDIYNKEKINEVYIFSETQRVQWTNIIKECSNKFKKIEDLNDLNIDLFSYRQLLVEKKMYISDLYNKLNRLTKKTKAFNFRELRKTENLYTKSQSDFKILLNEMDAEIDEKLQLYQDLITFFSETLNTIDRMIFAVKYRLQIYEIVEKDRM